MNAGLLDPRAAIALKAEKWPQVGQLECGVNGLDACDQFMDFRCLDARQMLRESRVNPQQERQGAVYALSAFLGVKRGGVDAKCHAGFDQMEVVAPRESRNFRSG